MQASEGIRRSETSGVNRWSDKRILFVSGKGGVGKSMIAAGIAHLEASRGRRVLLAEIGDTSYFQDFWTLPKVGYEPVRAPGGFDLALWNGEKALHEYVVHLLKLERLYRLFFENRVMRALIGVAPGLNEIAILGKITSGIRRVGPKLDYDLIVVDSYATGHELALLQAPAGLREAINVGPMGQHSREIDRVIKDPQLTSHVTVTLLEELPVVETLEFRERMKSELGIDTEIVVNRRLEAPATIDELAQIEGSDAHVGLTDFSRYLSAIIERQETFTRVLQEKTDVVATIPQVLTSDPQVLIETIGEALRKA